MRESLGHSVRSGASAGSRSRPGSSYLASPAGDYFSGMTLTLDGARDNWVGPWPPAAMADPQGRPLAEARTEPAPPAPPE